MARELLRNPQHHGLIGGIVNLWRACNADGAAVVQAELGVLPAMHPADAAREFQSFARLIPQLACAFTATPESPVS